MLLHPAVIGVVAGVVVLGLWRLTAGIDGSTDPPDAEPTVPTVLLTSTADVSLDGGWSRVDLPGRSRLHDVWEVGGTLYASGWDAPARQTVIWTSPDGAIWRQVAAEDGQFSDAVVYDMIGFDGLVIAVGSRRVNDHPVLEEVAIPAAWRSADGETFVAIDDLDVELWVPEDSGSPEAFIGGGFTSIQEFADGLLVGGWEGFADLLTGTGDTRPGMWSTVDVTTFTRLADGFGVEEDTTGIVRALTTDGQSLVAAGASNGAASLWTSGDGVDWARIVADDGVGSTAIAATPTSSGALILGRGVVGDGESVGDALRLWASGEDGYTNIAATGLDEARVSDLSVGGVGVVAVGAVTLNDDSTAGALWVSADGEAWERVEIDPLVRRSEIRSVVVGERALVAVGELYDQPSVWVRPLDEDQDVTAGVGSLFVPPAWSTVFQQQEPNGSIPSMMQRAGEFVYGLSSAGWLWQSRDGDVWTLQDFDSIGLGEAVSITQIVAADIGWVAVGESPTGSVWFSADGQNWGRPTLAPSCCAVAVFRDAPGFTALVRDAAADQWFRAITDDGLVWDVDMEPLALPVTEVEHVVSIRRLGLLFGTPRDDLETVYGSIDGAFWFPIRGPDQVFSDIEWDAVWDLGGEIVASGILADRPVLYRSVDGVVWQSLILPSLGADELEVLDVGGFGDGLAVLVSYDNRPSRLLRFSGIGTQDEVPLDVTSGFSGLWSILVPNDQNLRMLGPDHGRMTIWEWIPTPTP